MQRLVGQLDHLDDPGRRDPANRLLQRHVRADVGDSQIAGGQHHRESLHAARLGDQLGVTDEAGIAELRRLLVHRHRDDAGDVAPPSASSVAASDVLRAPRRRMRRRSRPDGDRRRAAGRASTTCKLRPGRHWPGSSIASISTSTPEQFGTVAQDRGVAVDHDRVVDERPSAARRSTISGPTPEASPIVIAIGTVTLCLLSSRHQVHQRIGCTEATGLAGHTQQRGRERRHRRG